MASRWLAARDAARVEGSKRSEEDINTILECVRDVKFVSKMDSGDLRRLCGCMKIEEFGAHETIIQYGDRGDKYYIIIVGSVSVSVPATTAPCPSGLHEDTKKCDCLGRPFEAVVTLQKGMGFGELALQNDDKRSASVTTAEPTVVLVVQRADYMVHAGQTHKAFIEDRVRFLLHFPKISQALEEHLVTMKDVHAMANLLHEHSLKGNEVLVKQGDVVDNLIFVKSGSLSLLRTIDVNAAKQAIRKGGESRPPPEMTSSAGAAALAAEEQTSRELGQKLAQAMLQMRRTERQQKALALEESGRRLSSSTTGPASPGGEKQRPSLLNLLQKSPTFGETGGPIGSMLQSPTTHTRLGRNQQQQHQQPQSPDRRDVSLLNLLQATDLKHQQEKERERQQQQIASRSPSRSKSKSGAAGTAGAGGGGGGGTAPSFQDKRTSLPRSSLGGGAVSSTASAVPKAKPRPPPALDASRKEESSTSPSYRRKAPLPIEATEAGNEGPPNNTNNNNNDGNSSNTNNNNNNNGPSQGRSSLTGVGKGGPPNPNGARKRGGGKRRGQGNEKESVPVLSESSKWRKLKIAVSTAMNIKSVADSASPDLKTRRRMSSQSDALRAAIKWNEAKGKANVDHFMDVAKARTLATEFEYQRSVEERRAFRSVDNYRVEKSRPTASSQKARTLLRIGTLGPCQYFGDEQICNSCIYPYTLVSDPVADVYMMSKHDIVRRLPKKLFTFLFSFQKESVPSDAQFLQLHRQNTRWCNFRRGTREGVHVPNRKGQMETCPILCRREGKPNVDIQANLDFLGLKNPEWEGPEVDNPYRVKPHRPPLTQRDEEELSGTAAVFLRHFEFNKHDKQLDVEYRRNGQRQWRTGGPPPKKFDPSNDANTCIFEKNWNRCGIVPALDFGDAIDEAFLSNPSKEAPSVLSARVPSNTQEGGDRPPEPKTGPPRPSSVASGALARGRISRKSTNAPDRQGVVTPTPSTDASIRGSLATPQPTEGGRGVYSSLSSRFSPFPAMLVRETPMSLTGLPDLSTPSLPPTPVPPPTRPSTSMAPRRMQVAWEGQSES